MVKQEVLSVYTFDAKNIQKSELRPLHKFAQVAFNINSQSDSGGTKLYFS